MGAHAVCPASPEDLIARKGSACAKALRDRLEAGGDLCLTTTDV
jgi:hypothetical protein